MSHKFDASIPTSAIKSRKQGNAQVSYIDGHFVITTANNLLGHENWSYAVSEQNIVQCEHSEDTVGAGTQYEKKVWRWHVGYTVKVSVAYYVGERLVERSDFGFGAGIDKDQGSAHESAIKEAATDALKRALRSFGQAFGLALYDKSGEFIEDDSKPKTRNEASVEAQGPNIKAYVTSLDLAKDASDMIKAIPSDKRTPILRLAATEGWDASKLLERLQA